MDGLIAVIGFFCICPWAWRRIARHQLSNGRKRWLAHLAGGFLGFFPAFVFMLAIAVSSPTKENPNPDTWGIVIGWGLWLFCMWTVLKQTAPVPSATPAPSAASAPATATASVPKSKPRKDANSGNLDVIRFLYRESDANDYAERTVTVRAVDSEYIEGICHARQALRTFMLQRIRGDITSLNTGEVRSASKWAADMRRLPNNGRVTNGKDYRSANSKPHREWKPAVYFVGFREERRCELESMAEAAGWQVRQAFSPSLNVLVAGSLAGVNQIGKAESMGIDVMTEDAFRSRVS